MVEVFVDHFVGGIKWCFVLNTTVNSVLINSVTKVARSGKRPSFCLLKICHASLHIKSPTSTQFAAVQADRERPLSSHLSIHYCCRFYSATCPDWFCSISYAEIPVADINSEIQFADLRQVMPLCVKMWAVKRSGVFSHPIYRHRHQHTVTEKYRQGSIWRRGLSRLEKSRSWL